MTIIAAAVEATGWVLAVTLTGAPADFGAYALDPDGLKRLTLTSNHPGFIKSEGQAVAATRRRAFVATKPLRRPVDPADPALRRIDEVDHGNGTVTVRIALSGHVYATDSAITLRAATGWRTGLGGQSNVAVANRSTVECPPPIMRYACVPYERVTGPFAVELLVASHHPEGLNAVAAVRFTATDGNLSREYWATALTTSARYGDGMRCWAATIVPTGFTAGLVTVHAEVFPFVGASRATGTMAGGPVSGFLTAQSPMMAAYDPGGTRYPPAYVYVDAMAGSTTAASVTISSDAAVARAGTNARDVATAIQAVYLADRSAGAANGGAALTRMADNAVIRLRAGVHAGTGVTAVSTGLTSTECWPIVEGDPADPDPRANVVLQTPATAPNLKVPRLHLRRMTVETGLAALASGVTTYWWADDVEFRAKAGAGASSVGPFGGAVPAGHANTFYTRCRSWKTASGMRAAGVSLRPRLIRNCEASRRMEALVVAHSRRIADTTVAAGTEDGVGGWGNQTAGFGDENSQSDVIVWGCDLRGLDRRGWRPAVWAGPGGEVIRSQAVVNCLFERVGASAEPLFEVGDTLAALDACVIEGVTCVGAVIGVHNDPPAGTLAEANTRDLRHRRLRIANSYFDGFASRHDSFSDPETQALRGGGTANGVRPQLTGAWEALYGVGFENAVDGRRVGAGVAPLEFAGLAALTAVAPGFVADRSAVSATLVGGGDYRPADGSPLLARGTRAALDRDLLGSPREASFAVGAVGATLPAIMVEPVSATLAHLARTGLLTATTPSVTVMVRGETRTLSPERR